MRASHWLSGRWFVGLVALILLLPSRLPCQSSSAIAGSSPLPGLAGATGWINSKPLTAADLKGKVVLVDFWDYSCINCIRSIPYVRAWADKYRSAGLVVIGVHTPEFDIEKQQANVQKAVTKFGITYPVALDSDYRIWNAFHNEYWPAHYFIDAKGHVRADHFGEGEFDKSEHLIQSLLAEANGVNIAKGIVVVQGQGAQAAAEVNQIQSPETYIGFTRAKHFESPGGLQSDAEKTYSTPAVLGLNEWGLVGNWVDRDQSAMLRRAGGKIVFRFHARDLHLVLGLAKSGSPVRYKVEIDGHAPGFSHGVDTDAAGNGTVSDHRLYQLIRQPGGSIQDHTFSITFEQPGIEAFSFTFG